MYNQTIRKLAVFCLTSAALSASAVTAASSASASSIETWELSGQFDSYLVTSKPVNSLPTYKLIIDVAGSTADEPTNLFNNVDISPLATTMTYFQVDGSSGFISNTDADFFPIAKNLFLTTWESSQDNTLSSLNISSIGLSILRKGNNLFDLNLFGFGLNNTLPSIIFASDTNVSFNQRNSTPEPTFVLGLLGLAAFSLTSLKKTASNSAIK